MDIFDVGIESVKQAFELVNDGSEIINLDITFAISAGGNYPI